MIFGLTVKFRGGIDESSETPMLFLRGVVEKAVTIRI